MTAILGRQVEQVCSESHLHIWDRFHIDRMGVIRADVDSGHFVIRPEDCRTMQHPAVVTKLYADRDGMVRRIPIMFPFDDINSMISFHGSSAGAFIFCIPKIPGLGVWALCGDSFLSFASIKSKMQMIQNIAKPYCGLSTVPGLFYLTMFKEKLGNNQEEWVVTIDSNRSLDSIEAAIAQKFPRVLVPVTGDPGSDMSDQFSLPIMDEMNQPSVESEKAEAEKKPAASLSGPTETTKSEPAEKTNEPAKYNKRLINFMRAVRTNQSLVHINDADLLVCFIKIAAQRYKAKLESLDDKQVSDMTAYVSGMLKRNDFSVFQPQGSQTTVKVATQHGMDYDSEWPA